MDINAAQTMLPWASLAASLFACVSGRPRAALRSSAQPQNTHSSAAAPATDADAVPAHVGPSLSALPGPALLEVCSRLSSTDKRSVRLACRALHEAVAGTVTRMCMEATDSPDQDAQRQLAAGQAAAALLIAAVAAFPRLSELSLTYSRCCRTADAVPPVRSAVLAAMLRGCGPALLGRLRRLELTGCELSAEVVELCCEGEGCSRLLCSSALAMGVESWCGGTVCLEL